MKKASAMPGSPVRSSSGSRHVSYAPLRYACRENSPLSPALAGITLRHRSPASISSALSAPSRQSRRKRLREREAVSIGETSFVRRRVRCG